MFLFPPSRERNIFTSWQHSIVQNVLINLCQSPSLSCVVNSSKKLYVGIHLHCKELWGRPLDDDIQNLPQLDLTSPGIMVGSSMILESQTASFSLQHRLQGSPSAHPWLLKMQICLQKMMSSWFQVSENPLLYVFKLMKRVSNKTCKEDGSFWAPNSLGCKWFLLC